MQKDLPVFAGSVFDPFNEQTCGSLRVKGRQKFLELRLQFASEQIFTLFDHTVKNGKQVVIEKTLDPFMPRRVKSAIDDMPVVIYIIHDKPKRFFCVNDKVEILDDFEGFLFKHPLQKVIDILKMIIPGIEEAEEPEPVVEEEPERNFLEKLIDLFQ